MNINVLLNKMSTDIASLSMSDKVLGAIFVTVLSMVIVFAVLQLLIWILQLMNGVLNREQRQPAPTPSVVAPAAPAPAPALQPAVDAGELIAVLSAAVAASVGHQVRVVGVRRVADDTPVWARVGRGDHLIPEHHTPHK